LKVNFNTEMENKSEYILVVFMIIIFGLMFIQAYHDEQKQFTKEKYERVFNHHN
jgi:hypothetical protein